MESTSNLCFLDKKLFPHLMLIPAGVILTVLAFLNKRQRYRRDIFGGRPGLVIPFDFLGFDHNRFTISVTFAATAGFITRAVLNTVLTGGTWSKAFIIVGLSIEYALLCYPFLACVTTEYKVIGSIMGFLYTLTGTILLLLQIFDKCIDSSHYVMTFFTELPSILCCLFLLGRYLVILYLYRENLQWQTPENENEGKTKEGLTKPWVTCHVNEIFKPSFQMPEKRWVRCMRMIYSPERNFRFSVQTVSIVVVCGVFLYQLTVVLIHLGRPLIESKNQLKLPSCRTGFDKLRGDAVMVSTIIVLITCTCSLARFMECHKNNMLRMFKGDMSFLPRGMSKSQFMLGKCLKYAGFQIGYFLWGSIFAFLIIFILTFIIFLIFDCDWVGPVAKWLAEIFAGFYLVSIPIWILLLVLSITVFRDKSYAKDVIALDNRNLYLVVSYFFFFVGLPIGLMSSIFRVLKAMAVGLYMLPRVDHSVMPDGFQRFDKGFVAYICYLHVLAAHRNPVLRVFCQIVYDETSRPAYGTVKTSKKRRNKWFLLLTLMRNPSLRAFRKHAITAPVVKFVNANDVSVEIT